MRQRDLFDALPTKQPSKINIPRGAEYVNRSDMFRVLRSHRGWEVEVFNEHRVKWHIRVTGINIPEILCDLPGCVTDNHIGALTFIYASISQRSEDAGVCGHA